MGTDDWRGRLEAVIEAKGMSLRSLALATGKSPGYIHSILHDSPKGPAKDPSFSTLIEIAKALNVSLSYLAYGIEMTGDEEALLVTFGRMTPRQRQALLRMAETTASPESGAPLDGATPPSEPRSGS